MRDAHACWFIEISLPPEYHLAMDLELAGRRALVTGASKGIGLACAVRLAQEGCSVQLAARTEEALAEAAKGVAAAAPGVSVRTHALDLSVSASQKELIAAAGEIDILVNNAGAIPAGDLTAVDEDTWRSAWDLKVLGYVNLCRMVYPAMIARRSGVIMNVIGAAAVRPQPGYIAGAMGNSGLVALTTALGSRSLRDGVRVVAVNPGLILTDRMADLLKRGARSQFDDEARWEELIPADPAPGTVDQVADVVAFLVSKRASHVSGATLAIDGGATAR
jgi:3-oxoacyl-[acyl-carrier protein] reductase